MRTLELNKSTLWYVDTTGEEIDVVDDEGYYTGEKRLEYTEPKEIRLHLYPATGEVTNEAFGINTNVDMVTTTSERLTETTLLFDKEPKGDYDTTYTYKVSEKNESLNINTYGLKGR